MHVSKNLNNNPPTPDKMTSLIVTRSSGYILRKCHEKLEAGINDDVDNMAGDARLLCDVRTREFR